MITGVLILIMLFAALLYSGRVSQPAYAQQGHRSILGAEKRQMLWRWYRTSGMRCVGNHEASRWSANTGNGYYGKLQADMNFQRAYGRHYGKNISYLRRFGTANHWPKVLQIHMARHGWQARGFTPWPNTARVCGLL